MRFVQFGGMVPKVAPKLLGDKFAALAQDMDVYGGRFQPLPELGKAVRVVDVNGNLFNGTPATIHYADGLYIGFAKHTSIVPDYTFRLGDTTFLFVQDGVLYRQSAPRVAMGKKPIKVGIERPCCDIVPTASVLTGQGCEIGPSKFLCVPSMPKGCGTEVPFNTAFCFTYVNACGEESAPSKPSNHIEMYDGDAIKIAVTDTPPDNATHRRWYMAVADTNGEGHWLHIGEHKVTSAEFYSANCVMSMGEELDTEMDGPVPSCVQGVAALGDNQVVLWAGSSLYVSEPRKPHAYHVSNVYKLRYDIYHVEDVSEQVERQAHHTALVVTNGLHYIVNSNAETVDIAEVNIRAPAYNGEALCVANKAVFFVSPMGIYEFTTGGIELVTGEFFTEREWSEFADENTRIAFFEDRLHGVGRRNWIMNLAEDSRRDASFVLTTGDVCNVYADNVGKLVYVTRVGSGERAVVRLFGDYKSAEPRTAVWRSSTIVMDGLWRPTTCKVVSSEFAVMSAGAEKALQAFAVFKKKHADVSLDAFINMMPEYQIYYGELSGKRPQVEVIIRANGREYYRRMVSTNKPFLLPRKYRATDWSVEIRSRIPVEEVHLQSSRESLTG